MSESRIEIMAVGLYGLGDHLHPWFDASPSLQNQYLEVVRQMYELADADAAATRSVLRQLLDDAWWATGGTVESGYVVSEDLIEAARVLVSDVSTQQPSCMKHKNGDSCTRRGTHTTHVTANGTTWEEFNAQTR